MAASVRYTCAGRTDVGIIRTGSEDKYLMVTDRGVFIVTDGMGGHAAGEVASEMAVRIVARELGDLTGISDAEMGDRVRKAIKEANSAIFQRTMTEPDKRGMGSTATIMLINGPRYLIGQA